MAAAAGSAPVEYRQYRYAPPEDACDLLVIRHGESAPAREDRPHPTVDGHADPELDPVGVAQAERVANRLSFAGLSAIYVTTLRRTAQTAAPLAARLGLTPAVEPDLREVHLGDWEGAEFRRRVAEGDPIADRMFAEQRWDVIPGAESVEHLRTRVQRGISRIAAAHPNQRVAVVVHGGVIGMIMSIATGAGTFAFSAADNASISQIVVDPRRWQVRRFNDTTHLDPALTLTATPLT